MKKNLFFIIACFSFFQFAFAKEFDAIWCAKNGGIINNDIEINCITKDLNQPLYLEKIYDSLCIPYYSYLLNNKPLFLKITAFENNKARSLYDEFNWKIDKNELLKYI